MQQLVTAIKRDADNVSANTSRLINCYRVPTGAAFPKATIKAHLGTEAFADVNASTMRAMRELNGVLYVACGGDLHSVDSTATVNNLGTITDAETILSDNNDVLTIAAGGVYYTWDGSTLGTPTGGAFPTIGSVAFLSQFTFRSELNGARFDWTPAATPETLNATYFKTAQGVNDNILRVEAINGRLVLFKERSREVWALTGSSDITDIVRRMPGGVIETGLKSKLLFTAIDNGAFFVGDDGLAYLTDGFNQTPVSTSGVETNISQGTPTHCHFWEDEGHKFVSIRYSDRPADVLDLATNEWNERAENVALDPWKAKAMARFGSSYYRGTDMGLVQKLTRNNADVSGPMIRRVVSQTFYFAQGATIDLIEILGRMGHSDIGRDAEVWIRISRDGGITWSPEKWRSMGGLGDYDKRARWNAQGWTKGQLTIEVSISDPAEIPIHGDFNLVAA